MKLVCRCPLDAFRPEAADALAARGEVDVSAYTLTPHDGADLAPPGAAAGAGAEALLLVRFADPSHAQRLLDEVRASFRCTEAFPVREHLVHDDGAATTVARIGFLRRSAALTREQFQDHWTSVHAPLVMAHDPLFHRYVLNLTEAGCPWDGVVEQYFADPAAWAQHDRLIVAERAAVREDIAYLLDSMVQHAGVPMARR